MQSIFREKSMKHISSPEQLHDYMRVTSPRLWMLLGAIAALLIGFIVYASTATMENVIPVTVEVASVEIPEDQRKPGGEDSYTWITGRLPASAKEQVELGMTVRLGSIEGKISWMAVQKDEAVSSDDMLFFDVVTNEKVPLPDGEYDAELVLETTTPISFLWS